MTALPDKAPFRAMAGVAPRAVGRLPGWLLGTAGMLGAIAVWQLLAYALAGGGGVISRLPGPLPVARNLAAYVAADFAQDLASSLEVFAAGWLVGGVSATLLGLLLGRVQVLGNIFLPVVEAIRPISSIAWVPLSIVWFGFGFTSKVFLVGLAVFLVVIVYAVDGCRRIPDDLARTAAMLGMNRRQRFWSLILPGTLAEVLIGARVSLMSGWGTVIVAELVAANSGLGAHLIAVQQSYDVGAVVATMICFGFTGFLMNAVFTQLELRLLPWHRDASAGKP
jgi:ABC-type nitrate/sulfonate/bicarbonate transport system permease component